MGSNHICARDGFVGSSRTPSQVRGMFIPHHQVCLIQHADLVLIARVLEDCLGTLPVQDHGSEVHLHQCPVPSRRGNVLVIKLYA
jgi:hypothetical protein